MVVVTSAWPRSSRTQKQTFSALLFLYTQVLGIELQGIDALRAKRPDCYTPPR